eukprot:3941583-Amphidinium_carterae.1
MLHAASDDGRSIFAVAYNFRSGVMSMNDSCQLCGPYPCQQLFRTKRSAQGHLLQGIPQHRNPKVTPWW